MLFGMCESVSAPMFGLRSIFFPLCFDVTMAEGDGEIKEWWQMAGFSVGAGQWLGQPKLWKSNEVPEGKSCLSPG